MEAISLEVTQGKYPDVKSARAADRVPMVYYGKDVTNANFSADYQNFRRMYRKAGKSTIITLINENQEKFPALIHDIQYDPVTDRILHVDVKAVDMDKPIHTDVPLKFVGIAPAVKENGGIFVAARDAVEVKCLPKYLVHEIEVDISGLMDFSTSLTVADIVVPEGIQIVDASNINIASVSAPRDMDAEEAAIKAADEAAAVAVETKVTEEAGGEEVKEDKKAEKTEEKGDE